MIRIDNVTWTYPHAEQPSLRDLQLSIAPGEFVILCGASGSGKSTALRLINGLIPHFHEDGVLTGTVTVEGLLTTAAELDALGLVSGTVLQHPRRQFFADTVPEEVAFAMENFGFPPDEIRARVATTVDELAGSVPVRQRLRDLSGGQQQQVAIAAATAHRPRILLLDEPSSNLSADAVRRLTATLAGLKGHGVTIVVAEHRLRYLADLVDRVVVMREGSIDVAWTASEFRAVPDEELAREGLRGLVRSVELPVAPASGASVDSGVVGGVDASDVPAAELELDGIRCRLGGRIVLDLDRVSFAAGAVTAIRGVNGAGKSTLARIVTGLQRSAGTVRLDGKTLAAGLVSGRAPSSCRTSNDSCSPTAWRPRSTSRAPTPHVPPARLSTRLPAQPGFLTRWISGPSPNGIRCRSPVASSSDSWWRLSGSRGGASSSSTSPAPASTAAICGPSPTRSATSLPMVPSCCSSATTTICSPAPPTDSLS